MINLEKKTSQPVEAEMHYKMYKDGKKLVTAGITTLMFSGFVLGTQTTAHADTTSDTSSDGGQAQATTGGNAVTQTTAASAASATTATTQTAAAAASTATASQAGTITQPVNVDSSALDQAVDAAKQAGLNVTQNPTTSSTVAPSEVDSAKAQIESDYASQAAKLNEATEQQETANHYNDSKGDTTALDEAVKKAQSTPGMSVKQDETKTTTKSADDKSGIANWEKSTASDYASQVDAINKAIDAQKQNNSANGQVVDSSTVIQKLVVDHDSGSTVSVTNVVNGTVSELKDAMLNGADHMGDGYRIDSIDRTKPATFTVTYSNLSKITYNGRKITKVTYDVTLTPHSDSDEGYDFGVLNDFAYGLYLNRDIANLKMKMYYDDGELVDFSAGNAYLSVNSLNNYTNNLKEYSIETVRVNSGGQALALRGSSVTVHNGNTLYSDKANTWTTDGHYAATDDSANKESFELNPNSVTDSNIPKGWDTTDSASRYYGAGLVKLTGTVLDFDLYAANTGIPEGTYWRNGLWYNTSTIIPVTPTTEIHYHYNVLKVKPNWSADDLSYQYHNLNVTTTPDKNWTQGDQVVTGKTEIAGDVATATISMNYAKPSDSKESMSKLSVTDNYSQMVQYVTYQGAQVYENDQLATDQYNIVNDAKTGTVTATRKDASKAPGGSIKLVVDFKINENTPSGTKLINGGSATINNETATTPEVPVNTYDQTANKHWIEGSQVVDGKTYINDDVITTKVDMSLPDPSTLAHSLTNVTIDDNYTDFANKAKLQSYRVEENGNEVTDQYTVTNKDGHLTAVRKDASTAPAGTVSLIATWLINSDVASGTTFTNAGSGRINNHTVDTNTPIVKTYEQTANKHWVEGSQTVDDKTYINDDTIHARVEMSLPNKSDLAKPLTDVTLVDDYSEFQKNVTYQSAQVIENGKDATSQYTITNVGGKITAMRKTPGDAPAGNVQLLVNFKINDGVASGTTFTNRGSGRINNHTVNTNNAKVVTYVQSTDKHWVEGTQTVDGKTYVDGDTINGQVDMSLPEPSTLAKSLTKVQVVDNYSNFKDRVDYTGATVYENGKNVTSEYTITNDAKNGTVTAVRKDASKAPAGTVVLSVNWKIHNDVASGTKLINAGSGTINDSTVKTPNRTIDVYSQDTSKNWIEGDTVVNGKTYIDNDNITAQVTVTLPDQTKLAKKLNNVQVIDDYSQFADKAKVQSVTVYENGVDATSEYTITDANGKVTATRKDASKAPSGKVQMNVVWKINSDVASGTKFKNTPVSILNSHEVTGDPVTIDTYKPTSDKNWKEGTQTVNGKVYIASDVINAQVDMSLPNPSSLAKPLSKVEVVDDYSKFAQYVSAPTDIHVLENDKDVTDQYTITKQDGKVVATRKDASKAPAGTVSLTAKFKINENTPSGTKLINAGSGTLNNETVETPTPSVDTFKQDADKHWTEGDQNVDGKVYVSGDEAQADVSMTLPNPSTLAKVLTKVEVVDDYSKFADKVSFKSATVYENGKNVTDQYTITNADGKVTATRKDASKAPQGTVDLHVAWTINSDVANGTELFNNGSGTINSETVTTPTRTVKTFKQDTDKHWVEGSQVVDGKTFINGDTVNAEISSNLPDPSTLAKKLTGIKITDDYTNFMSHVEVESVKVKENDKDVSTEYDITIKDGKIVATRKDASKVPGGTVKLDVTFKVKDDVASGTVFQNSGAVMINDSTVETPKPTVVTYKQTSDKHWTEGSQDVDGKVYVSGDEAQADVSMSLPDPSALAKALTKVEVVDDYSSFADKVDYKDAKVYENGVDATSEYTIVNKDGKVTATRKDASKAPKGTVDLHVTWTIHSDVENGTELTNNGSGTINNETVKTPSRKVTVYTQDADKHWVEGDQTVDNKTYVDGDEAHGRVTMSLPDPSTLAKPLSDVTLVDDYTDFMDKVTYESAQVFENGKDMTAEYIITNVNGKVTAMRKDPSTTPAGHAQLLVNFKINDDVKSGTVLTNKGSGRINNKTVSTNEAKITVYTQDADKHWTEGSQVVDGEVFVDGAITHATVTTTLPDQSTLAKPLTDITITDDYSQFADKVDLQDVHVLENDKDVTDQYTITKQDGKVVATRKDASKAPAGKAQLVLTFKLHADVESGTKLINKGSSMINKHTVSTNDATITTFKPNPKKDIVVSVDNTKSLNGSNIDLNSTFDYKLEGATLPKNSNALSEYGFHDDYDQTHDQYNGGYVVLLNNDVTLTDGTVLKKGTDVTKYTTQTIDQENGKVDIEFDSDFLAKVDRTKSEFGATAYLAMTRIKAGDVENKYTNTINGTEFTSNTVTSHTDEPKPNTPETPSTPKIETPTTPQSTTPETPIKTSQQPVFAAVQPATVAAERQATPQQALPQTGNDKDEALALTGLASLLFGLGTLGLKKRRRRA